MIIAYTSEAPNLELQIYQKIALWALQAQADQTVTTDSANLSNICTWREKWRILLFFFVCMYIWFMFSNTTALEQCMKTLHKLKAHFDLDGNLRKATFTFLELWPPYFLWKPHDLLYFAKLNTRCIVLVCLVIFFLNYICVKIKLFIFVYQKAKW